jgi:hypothetical protein
MIGVICKAIVEDLTDVGQQIIDAGRDIKDALPYIAVGCTILLVLFYWESCRPTLGGRCRSWSRRPSYDSSVTTTRLCRDSRRRSDSRHAET